MFKWAVIVAAAVWDADLSCGGMSLAVRADCNVAEIVEDQFDGCAGGIRRSALYTAPREVGLVAAART